MPGFSGAQSGHPLKVYVVNFSNPGSQRKIKVRFFVYLPMPNTQLLALLHLLLPEAAESVAQLTRCFEYRALQKDEIVLQAGDQCEAFYLVESGYLSTCYEQEGVDIYIHFHLEGSIATDYRNAKAGIPSPFTIKAAEKSGIWVLKLKELEALCYAHPDIMVFGRRMIGHIALNQHADDVLLKMYAPAARYAYIETNRPDLLQRVPLSKLASYLGMNRRTLTRIRGNK